MLSLAGGGARASCWLAAGPPFLCLGFSICVDGWTDGECLLPHPHPTPRCARRRERQRPGTPPARASAAWVAGGRQRSGSQAQLPSPLRGSRTGPPRPPLPLPGPQALHPETEGLSPPGPPVRGLVSPSAFKKVLALGRGWDLRPSPAARWLGHLTQTPHSLWGVGCGAFSGWLRTRCRGAGHAPGAPCLEAGGLGPTRHLPAVGWAERPGRGQPWAAVGGGALLVAFVEAAGTADLQGQPGSPGRAVLCY